MKKVETPFLNDVYMASPCKIGWENMEGDDRVRFCGGCSKNVYNISELSRTEAEGFLRENGVSKCVRFYRRTDGTIVTNDCPVGLRKIRDGARAIARFVASIVGICLSFTACLARESSGENSSKEPESPAQSGSPSQSGSPLTSRASSPFPSRPQYEIADGFIGFRQRKTTYLPPYSVLTTGKYALGDEISKTDVGGREQIYLSERELAVGSKSEVTAKSLSGGVAAIDLPSTLLAGDAFYKAIGYEREGKLLTAESMYKINLKYFEQYPSEYDQIFKTTVVLRYAQLLRQLHRDAEAGALLYEFSVANSLPVHTR